MKIGDVVMLRSGGPKMTALMDSNEDGYIQCGWFVCGELKKRNFPDDTLVRDPSHIEPIGDDVAVFVHARAAELRKAIVGALAEGKGPRVVAHMAGAHLQGALAKALAKREPEDAEEPA